jgi:hypothetical protein
MGVTQHDTPTRQKFPSISQYSSPLSVGTCLPVTTWKANTRETGQFLKFTETRAVAALVYRSSRIVLSRSYTETSIAADSAVLNKLHLDEICYGLLRTSQSGVFCLTKLGFRLLRGFILNSIGGLLLIQ